MAASIPARVIADAKAGAVRAGYPDVWPVLVAIAMPESGGDPGAIGDGGHSRGYLQFYDQGLGAGHDPAELLDGVANMALGAAYIGGRLAAGSSLFDALQPWSTRAAALALLPSVAAAAPDAPAVGGGGTVVASSVVPVLLGVGLALLILSEVLD